ncbi:hypothetical protein LIER_06247 [Lithospermum erythrorhizon]|uniref:Regulator of Vps4 activity in the MVB pathway protein n=1 Tax=Lithospermum erythrorhizon TaxID=34254 RepID=A0AAV3P3V3_LITER
MGKKLDALLGRGFKTKKFKSLVNLAIKRLGVLKKQHQSRCSLAISDVTQILKQGHHERALLRAEQVVKEQNMLDVFGMIDTYCYLLLERVSLLEHAKECPEELKEGISSLIYTATRCGEFPELQDLRAVFASRFGKEFVDRSAQLRNNCGVSPKVIQKLSTRMHTIESRMKVLREIAKENDIVLQIEEDVPVYPEKLEKIEADEKKEDQPETKKSPTSLAESPKSLFDKPSNDTEGVRMRDRISDVVKMKGKYKDVAHAAQAAFESAAHAASAARAAVELSWYDSDDRRSPRNSTEQPIIKISDSREIIKSGPQSIQANESRAIGDLNSEDNLEKLNHDEEEALVRRSQSTSNEDTGDGKLKEIEEPCDEEKIVRAQVKKAIFDSIDFDTIDGGRMLLFESYINNEALSSKAVHDEELPENESGDNTNRNRKTSSGVKSRKTNHG